MNAYKVTWLFKIYGVSDTYYYTHKDNYEYGYKTYTFAITDFKGITLSRNKSEYGIQAPNKTEFTITNKNSLLPAEFENQTIDIILYIEDYAGNDWSRKWKFICKTCKENTKNKTLTLSCVDYLQQYLSKDYPLTPLIKSIFPDNIANDNMCAPVPFGTPYIPLRPILYNNKRYYFLGDTGEVYTIDAIHTKINSSLGQSEWTTSDVKVSFPQDIVIDADGTWWRGFQAFITYLPQQVVAESFTSDYDTAVNLAHKNLETDSVKVYSDTTIFTIDTDYTIDAVNGTITVLSTGTMADTTTYNIDYNFQYADTDAYDANGVDQTNSSPYPNDMVVKFSKSNDFGTNPADVIAGVLQEIGLNWGTTWYHATSFSSMVSLYNNRGLTFNGAFYTKQALEKILSSLLIQTASVLRFTTQVELHEWTNTSKFTVTPENVIEDSFSSTNLIKNANDSGYVAWNESGKPQDRLNKLLIAPNSTTDNISNEVLEIPYVQNSQHVQIIGGMYYQKKFYADKTIKFKAKVTNNLSLLDLFPDEMITINDTKYGGAYKILIDEMRINKDTTIDFTCTRYSIDLDNWEDFSPSTVTLADDQSADESQWQVVVSGPDSAPTGSNLSNQLPGRLRIGETGTYILLDPSFPRQQFISGNVARLTIGDLSTDDYGIEIRDANDIVIMKLDGSGNNTLNGWIADGDSFSKTSGGNTTTISTGATSFLSGPTGNPAIELNRDGSGFLAKNNINWDIDGNVNINGTLTVNSFPKLPSDEYLAGYWSFDDGEGAIAVDGSGNGNDGTLVNSPTWVDGISGKAVSLIHANLQYVNVPDSSDLNFGLNDFSVSFWLNFNVGTSQQKWSIGKGAPYNGETAGWAVADYTTSDPITPALYYSDGADTTNRHVDFAAVYRGTFNHFLFTIDRSNNTIKTYVNGEYKFSANISSIGSFDSAEDLLLGAGNTINNTIDGLIDEVRIYNKALTDNEVKALYLMPAGNKSPIPDADNTKTVIDGGLITTGTLQLSDGTDTKAGITADGVGDNNVRVWAGGTYANRVTAPFRVTQGGELTATNANITGTISTSNITATGGTVGGWKLTSNILKSETDGNARIELDQSKSRISIIDSTDASKVVMGYLNGLAKNDGTGTWGVSDYGFWAANGENLQIDGDTVYKAGDWIIENNGSYLINNASGETVIKLGSDTGERGLFLYDASTQLAKLTGTGMVINEGGDITLVGDDANPAKLLFVGNNLTTEIKSDIAGSLFITSNNPVAGGALNLGTNWGEQYSDFSFIHIDSRQTLNIKAQSLNEGSGDGKAFYTSIATDAWGQVDIGSGVEATPGELDFVNSEIKIISLNSPKISEIEFWTDSTKRATLTTLGNLHFVSGSHIQIDKIKALSSTGLALTDKDGQGMLVNDGGAVTNAYQPGFLAYKSISQNDIAVGTNVDVTFDTEINDNTNNFASSIFTAPITGKYNFSVVLQLKEIDADASYYLLKLVTSNRAYYVSTAVQKATDFSYQTIQLNIAFADMDANDTAKVTIYQSGGASQTDIGGAGASTLLSYFSGYLVS